jgi:PAS domain S-box-containing protein
MKSLGPKSDAAPTPLSQAQPGAEFPTRLIEGSPDCLKVLDLDGRLLSMNAGGMAVLEICDLKSFIGTAWTDCWQGEDRMAAQAAVKAERNGGLGRFVGFFPTTQTRKPMWFDVVVSPINDANGMPEELLAGSRDVTQWKRAENLLHAIVDGTPTATGDAYFRSLLQRLARGLGLRYAFVAECLTGHRARSLAFWNNDTFADNFEYDLRGTPCL